MFIAPPLRQCSGPGINNQAIRKAGAPGGTLLEPGIAAHGLDCPEKTEINHRACKSGGSLMKACLAAVAIPPVLLMLSLSWASATVRITDDRGGQIGQYLSRYHALRENGERVEIDGTCASACTMLLGVIPRNRICVTPRAVLAFHSAWTPTSEGEQISSAGNYYLWSNYPADVRKWIIQNGGLHTQIIYLRGSELAAMYPSCR